MLPVTATESAIIEREVREQFGIAGPITNVRRDEAGNLTFEVPAVDEVL